MGLQYSCMVRPLFFVILWGDKKTPKKSKKAVWPCETRSADVQFSDGQVNCVRKYIEVNFPIIRAEFHDQIWSVAPIIPTIPRTQGSQWGLQLIGALQSQQQQSNVCISIHRTLLSSLLLLQQNGLHPYKTQNKTET